MYALANMGHPSREQGLVLRSHHGDDDELHHGCYSNLISDPQAAGSVLLIRRYQSVSPSLLKSDDLQTPLSRRYIKRMIATCLAVAGRKEKVRERKNIAFESVSWDAVRSHNLLIWSLRRKREMSFSAQFAMRMNHWLAALASSTTRSGFTSTTTKCCTMNLSTPSSSQLPTLSTSRPLARRLPRASTCCVRSHWG